MDALSIIVLALSKLVKTVFANFCKRSATSCWCATLFDENDQKTANEISRSYKKKEWNRKT